MVRGEALTLSRRGRTLEMDFSVRKFGHLLRALPQDTQVSLSQET